MRSAWRKHLIICLILGLLAIPIYFLDLAFSGGRGNGNWITLDFRGLLIFWTYITFLAIYVALSSIAVLAFPKSGALHIHLGSMVLSLILLAAGLVVYGRLPRCPVNRQRTFIESASAQQAFPSDSTLQQMLRQLVNSHEITGIVVGVLDERGTRRVAAHGNPGPGALPIDDESVFEIGSMTKVFTGILLADMVRRGEVELADSVADLLPPNVPVPARNGKTITLLDLTTHFSGLPFMPTNLAPANPENPFADYTIKQLYECISSYEIQRNPGDAFEYSNLAVGLLGHALEMRTGTTYAALVSDRILQRLGMTHTAVTFTPWMGDHLVRGHDRAGKPVANWDFPAVPGMGGLRSTINDMLAFAAANLSSEETDLTLAMRDSHRGLRQISGDPKYPGIPSAFKQGRVGFNWFISRPGARRITWTVGLTAGYSSFLGLDIEARRAVVVLTNTGFNNVDYVGFHLLDPTVPLAGVRE